MRVGSLIESLEALRAASGDIEVVVRHKANRVACNVIIGVEPGDLHPALVTARECDKAVIFILVD